MGVYIKGMDMPTSCSECAFCGYYGNGEHMCDIIQKAVEYESAKTSRLDDCPLDVVPAHGQMSNADRIRAMTDEELAFYIVNHPMWSDTDACTAWLKSKVEVDNAE